VLYQCLTAHVPFPRESDLATLWAHISDAPPAASDVFPDVPVDLSAVVTRALAKTPEQRYASAGELARAAREAMAHTPDRETVDRPTRPAARPARPRRVAGSLYDRERELTQAAVELDAARSGSGRILLIEGQAGIGKSRLLAELSGMAEDRGFDVYSACGIELEREFAYGVVRQLFEYGLHRLTSTERASLFEGAAGLAESLLLRPGEPATGAKEDAGESAEDRMFAALHGLYWFLRPAQRTRAAPARGRRRRSRRPGVAPVPRSSGASDRGVAGCCGRRAAACRRGCAGAAADADRAARRRTAFPAAAHP
jgi:hypothetical protein